MIIILCDNCRRCEIITEINDKTGKVLSNKGWIVKKFDGTWHDLCSKECLKEYEVVVRRVNE